jgi:hypothetical protein
MLNYKRSLLSILCFSSAITAAQASLEVEPGYTRTGTSYVVKAKKGAEPTPLEKVLTENERFIKPSASLKDMDEHFTVRAQTSGFAAEVFDLFENNLGDLTVSERALQLLPDNHVLAVHKFEQTMTKEGSPAVVVQNARAANGTPTDFKGLLKYQDQDADVRFDINVEFDLTGGQKPKLSVVKTTTVHEDGRPDEFAAELAQLKETGKLNVAIYAPKGSVIPTSAGGTSAIRRKIDIK